MSFYTEFTAKNKEDAAAILKDERLPETVRGFITQGLEACENGQPVYVKARGHAFEGSESYQRSNAEIIVQPVFFRTPAVAEPADGAQS